MSRRLFFCLSLLAGLLVLSGFRPISKAEIDGRPDVAIGGYDTVAYHTMGTAVKGSPFLAAEWQGALWYFRSRQHRDLFLENPERYAPKYGGYCAVCVADSRKVETPGDPNVFMIYKGNLYLLQSAEVLQQWQSDPDRYTREADDIYGETLTAQAEAR